MTNVTPATDLVDEILAGDPRHALRWEPVGRSEYADGRLRLTRAQWNRILDGRPSPGSKRKRNPALAVWGIPVDIVP